MDFDGFLEHFRLPFWMFSDKKICVFSKRLVDIIFYGFGDHFWNILCFFLDDFWKFYTPLAKTTVVLALRKMSEN